MNCWKFLLAGGTGPFSGFSWRSWGDGRPLRVDGDEPDPCRRGVHACRVADLPYWLGEELWEVELAGDVRLLDTKVVATVGTLGQRVDAWTPTAATALALACARRTVHHAATELRAVGLDGRAEALEEAVSTSPALERVEPSLAAAEQEAAARAGASRCAALVGYARDAVAGVDILPVASLAYIAAHAADRRSTVDDGAGNDPYAGERAWQAHWLAEHLDLRDR